MTEATQSPREMASDLIASIGLTVESEFVPFSQSRNKDADHKSLNWRVTIKRNGREILTTDYSAGLAHCPAYKDSTLGRQDSVDRVRAIAQQCETGRNGKPGRPGEWIRPDSVDVLYSLVMDSNVIDSGGFESWAADYGYDPDSRKAESIYRQCLEHALKLRAWIGGDSLDALRGAFQDY